MTQPDREELAAARDGVRQALGAAFAEKATDEFCLSHRRRAARSGAFFGLEALAAPAAAGPPAATIVEFGGPPGAAAAPADWSQVNAAAQMLRAALPGDGTVRASGVLRQAYVASARNACYNLLTPVYDEIERLSGGPLQPGPEVVGAAQIPTLVTQICWLNRSLRTWAGAESLADVATDSRVTGIDVPRRLMPDATRRRAAAARDPQRPANQVAIGLPAFLRDTPATGKGVTVAVIDTEAAIPPSLAGRVVHRRNYTPEAWGNPSPHGTAVAGIIGAAEGDHGIAPDVMIYNYKVLATNRFLNSDDFGGALAIQQALEDNCDIANCSWGAGPVGPVPSREATAVDTASGLGMVTVKSAGNAGDGPATMTTPAESLTAVVVGATDVDGAAVQAYSSRGPAGARPGPDVVAPGGTQLVQIACALVGGGFGDAGAGTSYAAPHVSGVLALLLERSPDMLPAELSEWVRKHARPLAGFGTADQGEGLLTLA